MMWLILGLALPAGLAAASEPAPNPELALQAGPEYLRGIAVGMYEGNPEADYSKSIDEIAATGATNISIIAVYYQETISTTEIGPRPGYSPSWANIKRTMGYAKKRGLKTMLFPIVHITTRGPGDWRGKIAPADWNQWFASYTTFISHMAQIAQEEKGDILVVGTEYVSSETMRNRWLDVISHVRTIFSGKLLYSANWDHFDPVSFWDAVDYAGVTAYHRLTSNNFDPKVEDLVLAWDPVKRRLRNFRERVGKPLIITELGYPALDGANIYPWDETRSANIDFEEQRRCYEAFARAFQKEPSISGVYFWIWSQGSGDWYDRGFSPRGKPAEQVIREFFRH